MSIKASMKCGINGANHHEQLHQNNNKYVVALTNRCWWKRFKSPLSMYNVPGYCIGRSECLATACKSNLNCMNVSNSLPVLSTDQLVNPVHSVHVNLTWCVELMCPELCSTRHILCNPHRTRTGSGARSHSAHSHSLAFLATKTDTHWRHLELKSHYYNKNKVNKFAKDINE